MRPELDDIYMGLAQQFAERSHCIRKHVGAVLVKDTRIVSVGYNGPPAGTVNCDEDYPDKGCTLDERNQCSLAIHAEQNAILYAAKERVDLKAATLYVTLSPCMACARIIYTMGIAKVVYLESYAAYKGIPKDEGLHFLAHFGIAIERYVPAHSASQTTATPDEA